MKNLPLLIGTIVGTLLLVVAVVFFFSNSGSSTEVIDPATLVSESPHILGAEDASVTIVEFSDFQCPACRATSPLVKQVVDAYPDQVRVVYRHFPLYSIHPYADLAARGSEVAAEEGLFWEYHDLLFDNQSLWSEYSSQEEVLESFAAYAEGLGIDKGVFLEKIESEYIKQAVADDVALGNTLRIAGTPSLYVNGVLTPAPQLMSTVENSINSN